MVNGGANMPRILGLIPLTTFLCMPPKRAARGRRGVSTGRPASPVGSTEPVVGSAAAVEVVQPAVGAGLVSSPKLAAARDLPARATSPVADSSSDSDSDGASSYSDDSDGEARTGADGAAGKRRTTDAAWSDSDDDAMVVDIAGKSRLRKLRKTEEETNIVGGEFASRLRKRFVETFGAPEWATRDGPAAGDVLASTAPLLGQSSALPRDIISVTRQRDANYEEPSKAVVQSVHFHPSGQLLLTAGFDQKLRLFQVCVWSLRVPEFWV